MNTEPLKYESPDSWTTVYPNESGMGKNYSHGCK